MDERVEISEKRPIWERSIVLRFLLWVFTGFGLFKRRAPSEDVLDELALALEAPVEEPEEEPGPEEDPNRLWPLGRIDVIEKIWGEGYIVPLGPERIAELLPLLALTEKQSLLLMGGGLGGFGRTLVEETGVWVTAMESDAELAELASERCVLWAMQRRAPVKYGDLEQPDIKQKSFDVLLSFESLFSVQNKKELYTAMAGSLRTDGEMYYTDLVLPDTNPPNEAVQAWMKSEPHLPHLWPGGAIQAFFGTLNMDVRPFDDITHEYRNAVFKGWLNFLNTQNRKSLSLIADEVIRECAFWAKRISAIDSGGLKVYRFHAYKQFERK